MENPEKTEGAIKNGQSRENRRGNQEWTIQRKQKGQSRMDNPEKTEGAIKNGQSRETGNTRRSQTKIKPHTHSTICAGHHYAETIIVQTTGGNHWP